MITMHMQNMHSSTDMQNVHICVHKQNIQVCVHVQNIHSSTDMQNIQVCVHMQNIHASVPGCVLQLHCCSHVALAATTLVEPAFVDEVSMGRSPSSFTMVICWRAVKAALKIQ